jgi:membrane fusion protein, multidrug efflux system
VNVRVVTVLCSALLLSSCSRAAGDAAAEAATATVSAGVATVSFEHFAGAIDAIGVVTVRPGHIASLGAPGAARVSAVRVSVGDRVRAGGVLVELDPVPFNAAVQGAEAALLSATRSHERAQRLVDADVAPRKDLDLATSDLAQATSAAASARRLRSLATLRAPIAGVVTRLSATLGASVDGTASLVEVADPRFVDIVLAVSSGEAAQLHNGASVSLTAGAAEGGDSLGTGVVSSIAAAIDTATRTVAVRVSMPRTTRALRIGESVNGRIALDQRVNALLVPSAAVVPDGDEYRVFVLDTASIARARKVEIGARRDGRVEITSGLKPGERIVTDGAYQVDDGVRIVAKQQ